MINKEIYNTFCNKTYVPIFSKPWWLDSICGPDNWDVWIYFVGQEPMAAMPYYKELRNGYKYITKAPLTQNNGILFRYIEGTKDVSKQSYEESIINEANEFIESLNIDVYEQQFHYTFQNWLPFYWLHYTAIPRYTYVIENTRSIENMWDNMGSKCRKAIRKGEKTGEYSEDIDPDTFYDLHKKIFERQGLECPFSKELWLKLYNACNENKSGKMICEKMEDGSIASLMFVVWDEESIYPLLGGNMPEYQSYETYCALTWKSIQLASEMKKKYDFEGSVIKRITHSFREYGGIPKLYFRIRKIYNKDILMKEAEENSKYCIR